MHLIWGNQSSGRRARRHAGRCIGPPGWKRTSCEKAWRSRREGREKPGTHLQEQFDRILRSLHEGSVRRRGWPATAGLLDDACGLKGNHLAFGGGNVQSDTRIYFARFCLRG